VIVTTLAKNVTVRSQATPEDVRDFERAREIREAVERGEIKTTPWEEVKARLRKKGLLDE
jgi:hypothetical protein